MKVKFILPQENEKVKYREPFRRIFVSLTEGLQNFREIFAFPDKV